MSLRNFAVLMAIGTLLSFAAWVLILLNVDPREAGLPGLLLFYVTLGAACVGAVTLTLAFIRCVLLRRGDVPGREIKIAFRHALLFAVVAMGSLALSAQGLLRTWHLVALIAVVALVEALLSQARR